jgi:hypothetical protein
MKIYYINAKSVVFNVFNVLVQLIYVKIKIHVYKGIIIIWLIIVV